jgi:hypothetical protein
MNEVAATEARCLRCGRKLTAAKSVAAKYGKGCGAKIRAAAVAEARADFSADQQAKADELIRDGGLVPTSRAGVYRAASSDGTASYLVHAATCSCPAGLRGRRCYHQLAARIVGFRKPQPVLVPVALPASDTIWAELDALGATAGALAAF